MGANYLELTVHRLKPHEEWSTKTGGLVFILLQRGAAKCAAGTYGRRVCSGDVLVLNGEGNKCTVRAEEETIVGSFMMRVEHLYPLFDANETGLLQSVTSELDGHKFYSAVDPVARECHQLLEAVPATASRSANLSLRSQLLRVAATVLSSEFKNARQQRSGGFARVEDHMIQVFEKLTTDEILALSADELAGKYHYRRRHLNRLFQQYFGF
ncbi:MAG TPA: hypothetical protein VHH73_19030, partial [Verrucomicrobiae bacterium]|nr:hypothetical protein [Verrucomicrobiae bacterium]